MTAVLAAPDAASQIGGLIFAVLLLDPEGRIVEANPAAESLLGRSAPRLVGRAFGDVVEIVDQRVRGSMVRSDAPLLAREVRIATGAAERRINLTSSPLVTHPGWRTITLSESGMERGDEGEDTDLRAPAILAHEIKNPLAAIRGASQLLARRVEPRDRALAEIITGETDRIAGLLDRMQVLGRTAPVSAEPCNLHEAIRSAAASVRAARGAQVALEEEFDPSLPPVLADRSALEQVLINLIANACDACEGAEAPRVEVRTRFVSGLVLNIIRLGKATRLPVEIVISDNGPGIPPDLRDHIFEPFVTSKRQGQGLGLALVRKLVRDMGGRIAHERDEALGFTQFKINLAVAERAKS